MAEEKLEHEIILNGWSGCNITANINGKEVFLQCLKVDEIKEPYPITGQLVFTNHSGDTEEKFDITVLCANEYGDLAEMKIIEVKLKSFGSAENSLDFKAKKFIPWKRINTKETLNGST